MQVTVVASETKVFEDVDDVIFLNSESYGNADKVGHAEGNNSLLVNVGSVLAVKIVDEG